MTIVLSIILILILSSCNLQKNNTADNVIKNDNIAQAKTISNNSNTNLTTVNDSEEKFKAVENEIHMMKHNWMDNISKLYTDLTLIKSVYKWSDEIITWMGDEDWLYSPVYDTTIVVCKSLNTPAYAFRWKEVSKEELQKVKKMTKEMMNNTDMMWSEEMMNNIESKWEYVNYSAKAVKNTKWKIVLFFHANWCPSCKATDAEILSKSVPNGITILKVNFDDSNDLKQKYGVLAQTTFVQIDKDWNEISKWVWWGLEGIISWVK